MDTRSRPIRILVNRVQEIHTAPRADGFPYWMHPLRCHDFLLAIWKDASFESEIAMLFHDTLEDIEDGEAIIKDVFDVSQRAWPELDKAKTYKLIQDLTAPQDVPKAQSIYQVEQRFREQRVEPEAYLLKAIDMMDNTSDLISFYHKSPGHKEIRKHMNIQRLQKYSRYYDAIRAGLQKNMDVVDEKRPAMEEALDYVLHTVKYNLQSMKTIINPADVNSNKRGF